MNKLQKSLLLFFAFVMTVFAPLAMNAQTEGNWNDYRDTSWGNDYESTTEFTISTAEQLAQLAYMVNAGSSFDGKTITLTANIDLAAHYWTPIGTAEDDFRGRFEGDNKSISNLTINTTAQHQGLFGSLASAFVMDVNIVGCNITAGSYTGGIAGEAGWTTISNCSVSGEIHGAGTSTQKYYGGIVGYVSGSSYGNLIISGNTNTASVSINTTSGYAVGGIVGYFGRTTKFRNNFSTGTVSGWAYVGTLIGQIDEDPDYNEYTNNCYPAGACLTGAVGSGDTSTGHDIDGASVGFTITGDEGVTLTYTTPVKVFGVYSYYMSGAVVGTTYMVPSGNHFVGYTVNSGSISDAGLMNGSHILTGATENVTISASYASGEPTDFSGRLSIEVADATYNGNAHLQTPVVMLGETTLTENVDYTVSYSGACVNTGEYTLTVTGNGSYTGSQTTTFIVLPYNLNNNDVYININSFDFTINMETREYQTIYTGNDIDMAGYVEVEINYAALTYGTDYSITTTPSPINAVGKYTVNINGMGNYTGTKSFPMNVLYPAPTLSQNVITTATTATLTWEDDYATSWKVGYILMSNNHQPLFSGSVTTTEKSVTLTGLTPEANYMASVVGIYDSGQESATSDYVRFTPSVKTVIGKAESGFTSLPTNTSSNYYVSQQIYTASEIGHSGTITSIDFQSASQYGASAVRTVDLYMVHTSKTAFASDSDWISVSSSDLVFSGDVTSWGTVYFATPFIYNGTDNLAIILHDKTGSEGGMIMFGYFSAANDANQAIYIAGESDFDLTSMSGTGTLASVRNNIGLMICNKIFTTSGIWDVDANWTPAGVPASSDVVVVDADCTVPANSIAQAYTISLGGNGSLTVKEGGQLFCINSVTATMEKTIGAWTTEPVGGWYFIASPVNENLMPSEVDNMLTAQTEAPYSFDLYRLNGTTWENYHEHSADNDNPYAILYPEYFPEAETFYLTNGQGYLYANASPVTLKFTGATKPYATTNTIAISEGFNLVGNPYTFNAYINRPYYKLNAARTKVELVNDNTVIAPCTGIVVEYKDGNQVVFTKEPVQQSASNNGNLNIALAQTVVTRGSSQAEILDKAIVSFNEGNELGKFYFGTQNANIYIPRNDEEYAIASVGRDGVNTVSTEIPVNFKANENGQYTISVNPEGVEMAYLHLIDNITGADIDLLTHPSYSFEGNTTDYASRFRLVFVVNNANLGGEGNNDFAFFSNGNIIINGEGTLQIIDALGRELVKKDFSPLNSHLSTLNFKPGVYVLRLIDGDNVKTQKIVIR